MNKLTTTLASLGFALILVSCNNQNNGIEIPISKNSWDNLVLDNYQDVPPEWKYYDIPDTPFKIPLPTSAVIDETGPLLELFSLPAEESGSENWERDFGIELMEISDWNKSLEDYITFLYEKEVAETDLSKEDGMYYNSDYNSACPIRIYKINNIEANDRLTYCVPNRYEYTFLYNKKIYRFGLWFQEHAGAQDWAHIALKNVRIREE